MPRSMPVPLSPALLMLGAALSLSGCSAVSRLKEVGRAPRFSQPDPLMTAAPPSSLGRATPTDSMGQPLVAVAVPVPGTPPLAPRAPLRSASLFRDGAGALFRDQRAHEVGDILTIRVRIDDKANLTNSSSRSRGGSENVGLGTLLGLEKLLPSASRSLDAKTGSQSQGAGTINRGEKIEMSLAGIVTQVLPNGNLAIRGRQEIRVNYELRELVITGIIRPQDLSRDNVILHDRIAEARVIYGGRGRLSEAQQARYGQQIFDALFPF